NTLTLIFALHPKQPFPERVHAFTSYKYFVSRVGRLILLPNHLSKRKVTHLKTAQLAKVQLVENTA
ncbi:MAG: hypothetical protein ACE5IW_08355, partial [bacterium]